MLDKLEKEYLEYWKARTPAERLEEVERLRQAFIRAHPFLSNRMIKVVRKRKLHDRDLEKEYVDKLYERFYKMNKDWLLKTPLS